MRANRRGPASSARLGNLRAQLDTLPASRRRKTTALATEWTTRLRAMGTESIDSNVWNALHETFGTEPGWSLSHIAAHLDVDRDDLSAFMGYLSAETARHDGHMDVEPFLRAIINVRERERNRNA